MRIESKPIQIPIKIVRKVKPIITIKKELPKKKEAPHDKTIKCFLCAFI